MQHYHLRFLILTHSSPQTMIQVAATLNHPCRLPRCQPCYRSTFNPLARNNDTTTMNFKEIQHLPLTIPASTYEAYQTKTSTQTVSVTCEN